MKESKCCFGVINRHKSQHRNSFTSMRDENIKFMDDGKTPRCQETVFGERCQSWQCLRSGTTKLNGKTYCKAHNPTLRKKRQEARSKKWSQEWDEKWAASEREEKRKELFPLLVSALEETDSLGMLSLKHKPLLADAKELLKGLHVS